MTLDGLESLLRAATPRPWNLSPDKQTITQTSHLTRDVWVIPRSDEDMEAIVALQNLAPELIAVARAAEELRKRELASDPCAVVSRRHLDTTLAALRAKIGEAT